MIYEEINVQELKEMIDSKSNFILLDVRSDNEVLVSKINSSIHIPMHEIPNRLNEIDKDKLVIVQCKLGQRSAKVCEFLIENNYKNVKNLHGGIKAWSEEIDPSILVL